MRATISVSGRGLIALPAEMRKAAGIRPLDSLIAETTSEGILLRPALTLPVEIYTPERVAEFDAAESELSKVPAGRCARQRPMQIFPDANALFSAAKGNGALRAFLAQLKP